MNQEQLESLPYPMFETNWYERMLLRKALRMKGSFLCNRLKTGVLLFTSAYLRYKVVMSLCGWDHLEGYLYHQTKQTAIYQTEGYKLRNIWIRKLLAYKGE